MAALLGLLTRTGMRKGLKEGSRVWLAVGISAWGLRRLSRMASRREELVFREKLLPGERMVVGYSGQTFEVEG